MLIHFKTWAKSKTEGCGSSSTAVWVIQSSLRKMFELKLNAPKT